jgi:hypothetical protein
LENQHIDSKKPGAGEVEQGIENHPLGWMTG